MALAHIYYKYKNEEEMKALYEDSLRHGESNLVYY